MYKYTEFASGSVMCTAAHGKGHVCIICDDPDLTPLQRADKARQQVDEILARLDKSKAAHRLSQSKGGE
jgi:hypothetical protein